MKRPHKYGAKKTACAVGHVHPSAKEARRCGELHLLQRAGQISDLKIQVPYWFVINGVQVKHANGRRLGFTVDFTYIENGKLVAEDPKGGPTRTEAYVVRAAIFRALHPEIELRET